MRGEGWASPVRDAPHPRAKRAKGQNGLGIPTSYFCPEGKKNAAPPILAPRVWSLLPVSLPNRCAVHNRAASAAACLRCSCHTIEPSTDMGKNAHIRVPIYQQQQALRVAAKQFVNHVSSPPDEGAASSPSTFVPAARAGFPATSPATSPATPTDTATFAISDPTWTWGPSSSHVQPTWAPQPERKCGGHGGGDHACALAVDVAALLQLTAWVEKLDAINHMNGGEDQLIINIRSQAVGVLDAWTKRWYATHAMTDDARR